MNDDYDFPLGCVIHPPTQRHSLGLAIQASGNLILDQCQGFPVYHYEG